MKQSSSLNSTALETTRTFVPGWWVEAFEHAVTNRGDGNTLVLREGITPLRLDANELALLALVLGEVQRQVFLSDSQKPRVELDLQSMQKLLPAHDTSSRERLMGVIQALPGLRFLAKDPVHESLKVAHVFSMESWSTSMNAELGPRLCLELTDRGCELLCGYIDAHLDLLHELDGQSRLQPVNFGRQPLVLWTPIWLELGLTEQALYARMEQMMQNQSAWLRLDGLAGASLEWLTRGLKVSKKNIDMTSLILDRLRMIVKLGRRLVAHGLLQKEPSTEYMALSGQGTVDSPMLLWQASAERLKSRAEVEYFGLASARILKGPITQRESRLMECFARISKDSTMLDRLRLIWSAVASSPGCGIHTAPGLMVQSHVLFMEWIARSVPNSLLPLNAQVSAHPVATGLATVNAGNAERVFAEFTRVLQRSHELGQIINRSDLSSPFSLALGPLRDDVRDVLLRQPKASVFGFGPSEDFAKSSDQAKIQPPRVPLNRIPVNKDPKIREKTDLSIQKLRKMAQDELEKMIQQSPLDYAKLKQTFLSSLDDEKKSLVLDVQRRLDSKEFDRQLKPRIVRYMVEHPGAWKSVSNTLLL